jgi:hypothetical protein
MKTYTFYNENNDFKDLLSDKTVKSAIRTKVSWKNYLMLGFANDIPESTIGYLLIKYGEMITNKIEKDYTPKPNIDYIPIKK